MSTTRRFHLETLPTRQRQVMKACGPVSSRWGAYLAGGTALALHIGHRRSEDLDWFTPDTLDPPLLLSDVRGMGFPVVVDQNNVGTFLGTVGGVKFSAFRYRYPLVDRVVKVEGCRLASPRDLGAMKLAAIMSRATKRDYVDIHALLTAKGVSVPDLLTAFRAKYPNADPRPALRALIYFDDVEQQQMPVMLASTRWEDVKAGLVDALRTKRA